MTISVLERFHSYSNITDLLQLNVKLMLNFTYIKNNAILYKSYIKFIHNL